MHSSCKLILKPKIGSDSISSNVKFSWVAYATEFPPPGGG